jgi:hypothetical protein
MALGPPREASSWPPTRMRRAGPRARAGKPTKVDVSALTGICVADAYSNEDEKAFQIEQQPAARSPPRATLQRRYACISGCAEIVPVRALRETSACEEQRAARCEERPGPRPIGPAASVRLRTTPHAGWGRRVPNSRSQFSSAYSPRNARGHAGEAGLRACGNNSRRRTSPRLAQRQHGDGPRVLAHSAARSSRWNSVGASAPGTACVLRERGRARELVDARARTADWVLVLRASREEPRQEQDARPCHEGHVDATAADVPVARIETAA